MENAIAKGVRERRDRGRYNVVLRLLTGDDARAAPLFRTEEIWLSKTVILES
jgi:hypothetical protein